MPVDLDATYYRFHDEVTVIAPGFGVRTRHDAHLTINDDGVVQATKFGLEPASPSAKQRVEQKKERYGEQTSFNTESCTLRVYMASQVDEQYIPTTLGERHKFDDNWFVYDTETDKIYEFWRDELNNDSMVVSAGKETAEKITSSEIEARLDAGRYQPVMKVGQQR